MVENLKELNRLVQKPDYRQKGNWYARNIIRDAALPFTWLFLHTPVTANQVTLAAFFLGLFGNLVLGFPSTAAFLAGTLLLQFWYLLDHVDGQIARYRKTASLTGRFFDFLMHHFIHATVFIGLGLYGYWSTNQIIFFLWGVLTCLVVLAFNMIHDIKYKTIAEHLDHASQIRLKDEKTEAIGPSLSRSSFLKSMFSLGHKLMEMHILMNLMTAGAALTFLFNGDFELRLLFLAFYGVVAPVICVAKITYWIQNKRVDADFHRRFEIISH